MRVIRKVILAAILIVSGIIGVIIFSTFVPYNMDEFLYYNTIICLAYPFGDIDPWCRQFDLNFLNTGLILPLRTFHYVGSFSALYYFPLFYLWKSPLSARFLGLIFLFAGAYTVSLHERVRLWPVLAGMLLFFPYVFQHLVDTGPVTFPIFAVFLFCVLVDRWVSTIRARYAAGIVILIFLGIWTKLAFLWYVPAFAIIALYAVVRHRRYFLQWSHVRSISTQLSVSACALAALVGSLLFSSAKHDSNSYPLWDQLKDSESYTLREMWEGAWTDTLIAHVLRNPMEASQRPFDIEPPGMAATLYVVLLALAVPFLLGLYLVLRVRVQRVDWMRSAVYYFAFLLTCFMIVRTKAAAAMHHAVMSLPFLILAVVVAVAIFRGDGLSRWKRWMARGALAFLLIAFLTLNGYFFMLFPSQHVKDESDASKQQLHRVVSQEEIARKYFIVANDWGIYFYQGLFGAHEQSVLFWTGVRDAGDIDRLRKISQEHGRKLLFIYSTRRTSSDIDLIRSSFELERCNAVPHDAVWQLLGEPDPLLQRACDDIAQEEDTFWKTMKGVF